MSTMMLFRLGLRNASVVQCTDTQYMCSVHIFKVNEPEAWETDVADF